MKKKLKICAVSLLGFSGVVLLLFILFNLDALAEAGKHPEESTTSETKETSHSKYPRVDIVTEISQEKTYSMAIHYPEFKDEALNKNIQEFVNKQRDEYLEQIKINEEFLRENQASLHVLFDIYIVDKDIYSIVFHVGEYIIGANGNQRSKVFLVDLKDNRFIEQTEIIIDNRQNRERLYQLLLNKIQDSPEYEPYLFQEHLEDWIEDKENNFSNMYIKEGFLVFKFDKYTITAGAAGSPEIPIPLEEVKDIIHEDWKEILFFSEADDITKEPNRQEKEEKEEVEEAVPEKKRIALTFDDGPHPVNTLGILELLDEYNAKATFFMLGNRVDFYPNIAKEVSQRGHEIGNHTWNHKDLTIISKEEIQYEIQATNDAILEATGEKPELYRPPYGSVNDQVDKIAKMSKTLWTVDTNDWKSRDPKKILEEIKKNVENESIILMHDIHDSTAESMRSILEFLDKEGYSCVTVSELLLN